MMNQYFHNKKHYVTNDIIVNNITKKNIITNNDNILNIKKDLFLPRTYITNVFRSQ